MSTELLSKYCKSIDLISNIPSYSNESPNLHVEVLEIPSHRWDVKYVSIDIEGLREQRQFATMLDTFRAGKPFEWLLPIHSEPLGEAGGVPDISATFPAGAMEVRVINASLNQVDWLVAGDLIRFSNHTKVYRVLNDVSTDVTGVATIKLNAPLQISVTSSVSMQTRDVKVTMIFKPESTQPTYRREAGNLDAVSYDLEFIELL